MPKKSKIHIKGKNSFLTNKNSKKRKNIEEHSNLNAKKEKLEYNPRKRKNTNIIFNEIAKKEKLEHNPRKRKNNKEIFNINAKKGKYKTLTMEHNPRKRKNSEDIFNNINIKKNMIHGQVINIIPIIPQYQYCSEKPTITLTFFKQQLLSTTIEFSKIYNKTSRLPPCF